jgi:dTDP-glucose 4,6-dehydratase
MLKIMLTGAAGFIGSNLTKYLHDQNHQIYAVDKLTYASDFKRIKDLVQKSCTEDIVTFPWASEIDRFKPDAILNLAAESHVDNSIKDCSNFIQSNVVGVQKILEGIRASETKPLLIHWSTDEVYGDLPLPKDDPNKEAQPFKEGDALKPNSPYSASKASADLLIRAFRKTYHDFNVVVVRPSNTYGPNQHTEKLLPLAISKILNGEKVPIYGIGENVREWLWIEDQCKIINLLLQKWKEQPDKVVNRIFNIGSGIYRDNLSTIQMLSALMDAPPNCYEFVRDRPGHDQKYAVNSDKINKLLRPGPRTPLEDGLRVVIEDVKKRLGK